MGLLRSKVTMVVSVGDLVAGRTYRRPRNEADMLILRGYAEGGLSRVYDNNERASVRSNQQTVRM